MNSSAILKVSQMDFDMEFDQPNSILIADDHPLFRDALRQVVDEAFVDCECLEASDFDTALQIAEEGEGCDLILLDLNMPGMNGFNGLITLRNRVPSTPIVMVSAAEDPKIIREATTYGASGFITKSLAKETMKQAMMSVLSGEVFVPSEVNMAAQTHIGSYDSDPDMDEKLRALTPQQRRVLELMIQGNANKIIAYELDIAESTVKAHVSAILRKLGVHSRTQAVINAGKIMQSLDKVFNEEQASD